MLQLVFSHSVELKRDNEASGKEKSFAVSRITYFCAEHLHCVLTWQENLQLNGK